MRISNFRYVKAADPPPEEKADPGLAEELKRVAPEAPEEPKEDPADTISQKQLLNALDESKLRPALRSLVGSTYKYLDKYKVKHQKVKEFYEEEDGVDVVVNIDPKNFGSEAEILFDWTTQWKERLVEWLQDLSKNVPIGGLGDPNEVIFHYCDQFFTASEPADIANLLTAISTLQQVDARPGEPFPKPSKDNTLDRLEWALEITRQMMSRSPNVLYSNKAAAIAQAKKDEQANNLKEGQAEEYEAIVNDLDEAGWAALIKDNEQALKGARWPSSTKWIVQAIEALTEGKYKSKLGVNYDKDGSILVTLKAPFPLIIRFTRRPRGLEFKEVATLICDKRFVTADENFATKLIFANVHLGVAAHNTASEQVSKNRSRAFEDEDDLFEETTKRVKEKIKKLSPKEQQKVLDNLSQTPAEQLGAKYKDITAIIEKNPDGFLAFIKENPKVSKPYFEKNPGLLGWMKKTHPDLLKKVTKFLRTPAEPEKAK